MELKKYQKYYQQISAKIKGCPNCDREITTKNTRGCFRLSKRFSILKTILVIVILTGLATNVFANNISNQQKYTKHEGLYLEERVVNTHVASDSVEQARDIIQARVNQLGITGSKVYIKHNNIIAIEIPSILGKAKVIQAVETASKLKFIGPDKKVILTGSDVKATSVVKSEAGKPLLELKLNTDGTKKFAVATKKYIGKRIAIYIDDIMYSNPTVQSVISNGLVQISGAGNVGEAKKSADLIKSGSSPIQLKNIVFKVVENK